jgi:hypothetical protein
MTFEKLILQYLAKVGPPFGLGSLIRVHASVNLGSVGQVMLGNN